MTLIQKKIQNPNIKNVLILRWNVTPLQMFGILHSVLDAAIIYDTLILDGTGGEFVKSLWNSGFVVENFWETLAKSVKRLEIHSIVNNHGDQSLYIFDIINRHFRHLHVLLVKRLRDWNNISKKLCLRNEECTIVLLEPIITFSLEGNLVEIHEKIIETLNNWKKLRVACWIPLEANTINGLFSDMNFNFWQADEMIFDCKALPTWADLDNFIFIIKSIEIHKIRTETGSKVKITPLEIQEELRNDRTGCHNDCCLTHHLYESASVTKMSLNYWNKCQTYYKALFESFQSLLHISGQLFDCNETILKLMSLNLPQLQTCCLHLWYNIETWPYFPNMTSIEIHFGTSSYKDFEAFVKSCPSLLKLDVNIRSTSNSITTDKCIEIISIYLKHLQILHLNCDVKWLTLVGIETIAKKLN